MSLDVYLRSTVACPNCGHVLSSEENEVYSANVTHNLGGMANEAGVYQACWRPEEIGASKAKDLIPLLENGIADMKARPDHYKKFNPSNGWGSYDRFVPWLEDYLLACRRNPEAIIHVSR